MAQHAGWKDLFCKSRSIETYIKSFPSGSLEEPDLNFMETGF
jgi:hypothetical protein